MNVEGDGFRMELARMLCFRDVDRRSKAQLPGDISSSKPIESDVFEEDGTTSESNNLQFIRLPRDLEISLSEANGSPLIQLLNKLRDYASKSEVFYFSLSKEQWLRTVVNCESKGALLRCSGVFSDDDFSLFTIQSNVVPCEKCWEKLQRARSSRDNRTGATSNGAYFPSSSLRNQLTRDDQQERNILRDWIERYDNEMINSGPTDIIPRQSCREIKLSNGDRRRQALSTRENDLRQGRFRVEFWRGGRFGVKVFREIEKTIFSSEVKVLDAIGTHPHIVYSFGVSKPEGEDGYKYWMEKLDGNLYDLIVELRREHDSDPDSDPDSNLAFSVIDSIDILLQIAKAMTRLHELNVIHGDLKSDNILVSECEVLGGVKLYIVKVADFDSAEIINPDDDKGVFISGTDDYIAPEVWKTCRNASCRVSGSIAKKCDVYSFGITAVEVLSGQTLARKKEDGEDDRREDIMAPVEAIRSYHSYPSLIDLIYRCLNHDSFLRLSFAEVTTKLEEIQTIVKS